MCFMCEENHSSLLHELCKSCVPAPRCGKPTLSKVDLGTHRTSLPPLRRAAEPTKKVGARCALPQSPQAFNNGKHGGRRRYGHGGIGTARPAHHPVQNARQSVERRRSKDTARCKQVLIPLFHSQNRISRSFSGLEEDWL